MAQKNVCKIPVFRLFLLIFTTLCLTLGALVFADSELPNRELSAWSVQLRPNGTQLQQHQWQKVEQTPKLPREYQGFIAYKANFAAPSMKGEEPLGIYLGQIGDVDRVFVNGHLIGQTGGFPPEYHPYLDLHREYLIPQSSLRQDGLNELLIEAYVEYVGIKGLDISAVEIGSHKTLQRKKYLEEVNWYFLKLGLPVLCLFLSIVSMPWMSTKIQLRPNLLLVLTGLGYCIFGFGKSRMIFHFLEPLLAYKILTTAALFGLVFIFIYSLDLCRIRQRWPYVFAIGIPTIFALRIYSGSNLYETSLYVKDWLYGSIPLLFIIATTSLFLAREKSIWVRIGLACLTVVAVNDIFVAVRLVNSVNLMDFGFCVFILSMLISQMVAVKRGWVDLSKREADLMWSTRFIKMATQVGHDIRTPLSSMEPAIADLRSQLESLSEPARTKASSSIEILEAGAESLRTRSAKLLAEYKSAMEKDSANNVPMPRLTLMDDVVFQVVNEVRATAPAHVNFELQGFDTAPDIWGVIEVGEIQSAISNILRNAVEAMNMVSANPAVVRIALTTMREAMRLAIVDSGNGMASDVLAHVFNEGFTHGKVGGTGLGLAQAKKALELNEGKIAIDSEVGKGTRVTITLPREREPSWLKKVIRLSSRRPVYFVDDDPSMLSFWRDRMQSLAKSAISVSYHSSFRTIPKEGLRDAILILDHEFRADEITGLDWLKKQSIIPETYLCTASYDDPKVQEQVKTLRISMIPKPILKSVVLSI